MRDIGEEWKHHSVTREVGMWDAAQQEDCGNQSALNTEYHQATHTCHRDTACQNIALEQISQLTMITDAQSMKQLIHYC